MNNSNDYNDDIYVAKKTCVQCSLHQLHSTEMCLSQCLQMMWIFNRFLKMCA